MTIYTIGDSHSTADWNNIKNLHTFSVGPILCYNFAIRGINLKDGNIINDGDTVIFCFGEIDCRCHIHKHITNDISYTDVIDYIVDTYFRPMYISNRHFIQDYL